MTTHILCFRFLAFLALRLQTVSAIAIADIAARFLVIK